MMTLSCLSLSMFTTVSRLWLVFICCPELFHVTWFWHQQCCFYWPIYQSWELTSFIVLSILQLVSNFAMTLCDLFLFSLVTKIYCWPPNICLPFIFVFTNNHENTHTWHALPQFTICSISLKNPPLHHKPGGPPPPSPPNLVVLENVFCSNGLANYCGYMNDTAKCSTMSQTNWCFCPSSYDHQFRSSVDSTGHYL
jgi:hypothetical protein